MKFPVVAVKNGGDFLNCVLGLCGSAEVSSSGLAFCDEILVCVNESPHLWFVPEIIGECD